MRIRLRDLAGARVKYGYRRLHLLLEREGWKVNHRLVCRLYAEEWLAIRRRGPRRHRSRRTREKRPAASSLNENWSTDFMMDQLFSCQWFRLLTLVGNFSRVSLAIEAGQRLTGDGVVRVLERVSAERGCPGSIRVDNGPEFISKSLNLWAYWNRVTLDFSRRHKITIRASQRTMRLLNLLMARFARNV